MLTLPTELHVHTQHSEISDNWQCKLSLWTWHMGFPGSWVLNKTHADQFGAYPGIQREWRTCKGPSLEPCLSGTLHFSLCFNGFLFLHISFFLVRKFHLHTIPITFHLSIRPFTGDSEDVVRPHMNGLKISHNFISHNLCENYILFLLCWWRQLQICWPWWMAHGNSSLSSRHALHKPLFS